MSDVNRNDQVRHWHAAMGLPIASEKFDDPEFKMRRARLIAEECAETLSALLGSDVQVCQMFGEETHSVIGFARADHCDEVDFFDGLLDLEFVCEGSAVELGWDSEGGFAEVTRSNMTKRGGRIDEHGKLQKPEGFEPPRLERFIR